MSEIKIGEYEVNDVQQESPVKIIYKGTLGAGNIGSFGPNSEREAAHIDDFGDEKYLMPVSPDSHCMDDRIELAGIRLPGNRTVTEINGDYMDPEIEPRPISQAIRDKVQELVATGNPVYFHEGCAALAVTADGTVLRFIGDNKETIAHLAMDRLRILGRDHIELNTLLKAAETAGRRGREASLFDASAPELLDIARQAGADMDAVPGEHTAAGAGWLMSRHTHHNGMFREDHKTDDGEPQGVLTITPGAYLEQLKEDGFDEEEIDKKIMQAVMISVAVLKIAEKDNAPDVIAGHTS